MQSDSVYNFIGDAGGIIMGATVMILIFVMPPAVGAYFIATAICKNAAKTSPPKKNSSKMSIFLTSFCLITVIYFVLLVLAVPFGRTIPVRHHPVPVDPNHSNH